uniref:Uncharacterized protein n=1 Tax=Anguilla anguilla TaxID=7936 RepID=A0A0E9QPY5_ANGAN
MRKACVCVCVSCRLSCAKRSGANACELSITLTIVVLKIFF